MKIVLDTNIILSGLAFPGGAPWKILDYAISGEFEFYICEEIIAET